MGEGESNFLMASNYWGACTLNPDKKQCKAHVPLKIFPRKEAPLLLKELQLKY